MKQRYYVLIDGTAVKIMDRSEEPHRWVHSWAPLDRFETCPTCGSFHQVKVDSARQRDVEAALKICMRMNERESLERSKIARDSIEEIRKAVREAANAERLRQAVRKADQSQIRGAAQSFSPWSALLPKI
jgi:hypothetical protein